MAAQKAAAKQPAAKKAAAAASPPGPIGSLAEHPVPGGVISFRGKGLEFRFRYSVAGSLIMRFASASDLTVAPVNLIDQAVPTSRDEVHHDFRDLDPGLYVINWSFIPADPNDFETAAELSVDEILAFRKVKTNNSRFPYPDGFMLVRVFA